MILQPFSAVKVYLQAFPLLFSSKLRMFVLAPLLANILLMMLFFAFAYSLFNDFTLWMMSFLPDWMSFFDGLFFLVFGAISGLTLFYSFSIFVNIIAAPFMGFLSEKTEYQLNQQLDTSALSFKEAITLLSRTLLRELQKIGYFLPRILLLFILSFIPVINLISPILWLLFSAWMVSIQYMDYAFDNHQVSFKNMRKTLKRFPLLCWTFGGLLMFFLAIPIVNLIVMPLAVVAATILWVDLLKAESEALFSNDQRGSLDHGS